ncbi:hypothetical protein MP638_003172 [Amoeboaphelidium occidentale]|nr:hypothetical protein MP638_003172 [Amoeboaphelidium occidentale]
MSLIYVLVARESTILAEHSNSSGNFAQIAQTILDRIESSATQRKLTYVYDDYLFHYTISSGGLICMCMADASFGRRIPFAFLQDIENTFTQAYGEKYLSALPYGMNEFARVLSTKIDQYNSNQNVDILCQLNSEIDQVKDVMVQNIEKVLERGERIEILVDKTDSLNQAAFQFKKRSTALKRRMWWKNAKLLAIMIIVSIIVLYLLVSGFCGFGFQNC